MEKTTKKKTYGVLIVSTVLLIASIIFTVYAYHTSYQDSVLLAETLTADEKLDLQRPYSYGLTALFFSIMLAVKGLYNALIGISVSQKSNINRLAQAGLLAALCYIGFAFFKIDIPVGPEKTAFHFGNVFCVLAALLLGGYWGGLAGAVGMTIADLTTAYVTSAPKTFLLKLCIGLIVGFVAHKLFKLSREHSAKYVRNVTIAASACGMLFNMIADPLVGYFYKIYLLGIPQDISTVLAKWSALTTSVNAVVAIIAASLFYIALRPALKKAGLFVVLHKDAVNAGNEDNESVKGDEGETNSGDKANGENVLVKNATDYIEKAGADNE